MVGPTSWIRIRSDDTALAEMFWSGNDIHILGPELDMRKQEDINILKKIRCYRGIRHEKGQMVRGQRTKSHGRSGLTVGVVKKAQKSGK